MSKLSQETCLETRSVLGLHHCTGIRNIRFIIFFGIFSIQYCDVVLFYYTRQVRSRNILTWTNWTFIKSTPFPKYYHLFSVHDCCSIEQSFNAVTTVQTVAHVVKHVILYAISSEIVDSIFLYACVSIKFTQ